MTIPIWPSDLPQRVLREGYDEQSADGRLFTRMSAGPPKTRVRYSRVLQTVPCMLSLDYNGKARLERFVEEELVGGSLRFIIPDQTHDGVLLANEDGALLLDSFGNEIANSANWLVMFAENSLPHYPPNGVRFHASFTLIVLP